MPAYHTSCTIIGVPFNLLQAGALFSGTKVVPVAKLLRDMYYGGLSTVQGTVKEKNTPTNTPLRRRVVLIDERSRMAIREVWSDAATGNYEFHSVAANVKYTVISYDHTGAYNGAIATGVVPELMP